MNRATLILLAVLAPAAALGATTKDAWQTCLDKGLDMTGCSITELNRLEPTLSAGYQSASPFTHDRDRLTAVRQAWIAYSDAACERAAAAVEKDNGMRNSITNMTRKGCLVSKTRHRIYELSSRGLQELTSQNPSSSAFKKCSSGGTASYSLTECLEAELARNDKILNTVYRNSLAAAAENDKELGVYSGDERGNLIEAERKWIVFRDEQCRYLADQQAASETKLADLRCRTAMTKYRTQDLRNGK